MTDFFFKSTASSSNDDNSESFSFGQNGKLYELNSSCNARDDCLRLGIATGRWVEVSGTTLSHPKDKKGKKMTLSQTFYFFLKKGYLLLI